MASDLASLGHRLSNDLSTLQGDTPPDESTRQRLLSLSQQLAGLLENPTERLCRSIYLEPYLFVATRVLLDLEIFNTLAAAAPTPQSVEGLARKCNAPHGADPALLSRLLKHVATQSFVRETGADEYTASPVTHVLAAPEGHGVMMDMYKLLHVHAEIPEFLRKTGYKNPTDKDASAWMYGFQTPLHYFEYISQPGNEWMVEAFQGHMRFKTLGCPWFEMDELVAHVFGDRAPEQVLIVDVGGSTGLDLQNFHAGRPEVQGRLVLQDTPAQIAALDVAALRADGIEAQAHDFFTPEPVHGACVYYLKMILHDWPDESCRSILKNLRSAMEPGRSRILLNEIVVPEVGAGWFETSVDMIMLAAHSAHERREKEWRELVGGVEGLKVVEMWDVAGAVEKIVEIEAF